LQFFLLAIRSRRVHTLLDLHPPTTRSCIILQYRTTFKYLPTCQHLDLALRVETCNSTEIHSLLSETSHETRTQLPNESLFDQVVTSVSYPQIGLCSGGQAFFKHAREQGFFSNQTAPAKVERRLTLSLSLLSLTCTSVGPNLWCKWRCHCWFRGGGEEGARVEEGG
jgi:hypothetical protein